MPNWNDLLNEVKEAGSTNDVIRRRYLKRLAEYTGRNTILYYSGWLQRGHLPLELRSLLSINDGDKNGFMSVIHKMDRKKGLDLLLHTPGGDMAATESLIAYLRSMFGINVRAVVPQIAMSGGSMLACSCREIIMGAHSNIGPFDPQLGGTPAQAIVEEFRRAAEEIAADHIKAYVWQPIIQKYGIGLISQCEKAIEMADQVVKEALITGMFRDDPDATAKAQAIVNELGSHAQTKMHNRHIEREKAKQIGLNVIDLEADQTLQDLVLSVHHAAMLTFEQSRAFKIIENHEGVAYIGQTEATISLRSP